MAKRILETIDSVGAGTQQALVQYTVGETDPQVEKLRLYHSLDLPITLFASLFGYMKFFDPTLTEEHPNNFYMEREWRVFGQVRFCLSDVVRIFLPPEYVGRFREAVPGYAGPIVELAQLEETMKGKMAP